MKLRKDGAAHVRSQVKSAYENLDLGQAAYDFVMRAALKVDTSELKPGLRLAVGVSGGADSVALLRALAERRAELGLVLCVAHLHHGLRGDEADGDEAFCCALAEELGLPFHSVRVDLTAEAK